MSTPEETPLQRVVRLNLLAGDIVRAVDFADDHGVEPYGEVLEVVSRAFDAGTVYSDVVFALVTAAQVAAHNGERDAERVRDAVALVISRTIERVVTKLIEAKS